jgi:hypothetical protein
MTGSPEIPRRKPKMAQGKKAGEPPADTDEEKVSKLVRETERLKLKKIQEILDRDRNGN